MVGKGLTAPSYLGTLRQLSGAVPSAGGAIGKFFTPGGIAHDTGWSNLAAASGGKNDWTRSSAVPDHHCIEQMAVRTEDIVT